MKRPRRWLFNGLAATLPLLSIAMAAMWVRSYFAPNFWPAFLTHDGIQVESWQGRVRVTRARFSFLTKPSWKWRVRIESPDQKADATNEIIAELNIRPKDEFILHDVPLPEAKWRNGFGFGITSEQYQPPVNWQGAGSQPNYGHVLHMATIPYWFLTALPAVLTAITWRNRLCTLRPNPGFCAQCGYDLRATPHRCPECGTVPAKDELIST